MEELKILLSNEALLVMLMAPSMIVGMAIIYFAYRLVTKFGERFMNAQEKQAEAFTAIANGFDNIKTLIEKQNLRDEDVRITLRVINERVDTILEKVSIKNG